MEIKRGIAVSPGVASGPALVVDTEGFRIPKRFIERRKRKEEIARLRQALADAAGQSREKQQTIDNMIGKKYGAIFAAHAMLMEDPELVSQIEKLIREKDNSAEYAVSQVIRQHAKTLVNLGNSHFSSRAADLFDIEKSILRNLLGETVEDLSNLKEPVIILAHDLTPSETASMDRAKVHAFATEAGGRASHTAIMAGVLEIPAVVGIGKFLTDVSGGDEIIVDGNRGIVILDPDEETRQRYEQVRKSFFVFQGELKKLRDLPAKTKNGTQIALLGNIEFPSEAKHCLEHGADGIGLYRTEFLYLNKKSDPVEAEHLDAYRTVVNAMGKRPVVIRTLDLGADKFALQSMEKYEERNPALGLRSLRICLRNLGLFKTQLRAILNASAHGDVRMMFPMVSTLLEFRTCKLILAEVKEDMEEEGIPFNPKIPVGTMIEVPSAALMAEELAREVNFFSIGTNDLTQYTLAADRTNENVATLYSPGDPAVLRLIAMVVEAGRKNNVDVSVCGEMSGDPIYTLLLLGMGLRQLSVTPHNIPEIKKIIRTVTIDEATDIAREALELDTSRDVNNLLREKTRRILPEVLAEVRDQ